MMVNVGTAPGLEVAPRPSTEIVPVYLDLTLYFPEERENYSLTTVN